MQWLHEVSMELHMPSAAPISVFILCLVVNGMDLFHKQCVGQVCVLCMVWSLYSSSFILSKPTISLTCSLLFAAQRPNLPLLQQSILSIAHLRNCHHILEFISYFKSIFRMERHQYWSSESEHSLLLNTCYVVIY